MTLNDVRQRMEERKVYGRRSESTVPLGTLTCGELIRMSIGLMLLALQSYPELENEDVVEGLIRSAAVRGAGGTVN